ncbi:4-(cytidine 5'-diphospho)-2-C-methyl-D-erythritol kinase [Brevundimonas sp.]|uniref:4-(cytidine 5'-diphospho)-2-C-methyl-D-erythritol kinase n=1 Tax=Brevundimonas sp. TaxID=1871086 RepID=UPI002FCA9AB8
MTDTLTLLAPAKVNLYLHVAPVRGDGYHPLDSLVAFADVGDRMTFEKADSFSFEITGPFSQTLNGEGENLVVRALLALASHLGHADLPMAVTLDKRLPIASGLGGGSSDAGAALRGANLLLELGLSDTVLEELARVIGADGPMCYRARPAFASGVGEVLEDAADLPLLHAVLLNPGLPSPTGAVYRAYDAAPLGDAERPAPYADPAAVIDWLKAQRNDLQAPALSVTPDIAEALETMTLVPNCRLVRMSGSGATVFGLFDSAEDAVQAALILDRADWWVRPVVLGAPELRLA